MSTMADIMDKVFAPDIRLTLSTGGGIIVSAVALTERGEDFLRHTYVAQVPYDALMNSGGATGLTIETIYEDEVPNA